MKKLRFFVWIGVILWFSQSQVHAQTNDYKYQAVFVSQFIKQIEWPSSVQNGNFLVGVMQNRQVTNVMSNKLSSKKVNNRNIEVKNLTSLSEVDQCDIVFIPATTRVNFTNLTKKIGNKPSLIVTEKEGMTARGSDINLILVNNRFRFEIKRASIDRKNLKVSAYLIRYAISK